MEWANSFRNAASRLASDARSSINETASEFQSKGVGGVFRDAYQDTAEVVKDISSSAASSMRKAAREMQQGVDAAASWITGEDVPSLPPTPSSSSSSRPPRGPVWRPPVVEKPPRLEDLRKGTKVYRRGALAEVVKVDYEAVPPSLVVRMVEGGNEVGTDGSHVSLGPDESLRCLALGVPVRIVDLQGRKELNGCRGVLTEYKADADRWTVKLTDDANASSSSSEAISVKPRNLSVLLAPSPEALSHDCSSSRTQQLGRSQAAPALTPVGKKPTSEFFAEPVVVAAERDTSAQSTRMFTETPPRKPVSLVAYETRSPKPSTSVLSPGEAGPSSTPMGQNSPSETNVEPEPSGGGTARLESVAPIRPPVEGGPSSTPIEQKSPSETNVEPEPSGGGARLESVAPIRPPVEVVSAELSSPTAATSPTVQDTAPSAVNTLPSEGVGVS